MTTNAPTTQARQDPRQVSNTLKRILNYNDGDASLAIFGTGPVKGNALPQGAFITDVKVEVATVFNAATTNTLSVGTNSPSFNNIVATADVNLTSATVTSVVRGLGRSITQAGDTTVYAVYTQTGTSATTGQALVVITYEGGWKS